MAFIDYSRISRLVIIVAGGDDLRAEYDLFATMVVRGMAESSFLVTRRFHRLGGSSLLIALNVPLS